MKRAAVIIAVAIIAGIAFTLSMPPRAFALLGWVFLTPLFIATRGVGFLRGFLSGLVLTVTAAIASTTLISGPNLIQGDVSWNYLGIGLYGIVLSLMVGITAEIKELTFGKAAILACAGIVLECLTFIKLPAHLALTQYGSAPMLALASVTGIWGVSWLVWFSNLALASQSAQKQFRPAVAGIALLAVLSTTIGWNQGAKPKDSVVASTDKLNPVAALQTDNFGANEILPLYESLGSTQPTLSVWPELSITEMDIATIQEFAASQNGSPVVATMHDGYSPKPHNAAVLISGNGVSEAYYKRKPFGSEINEVTAGTRPLVVKTIPLSVGLNICFDSCYPGVMRDTANAGDPDLIALPTLDPASPNGFIQSAHAAFTSFRAAELGIPIVRAETTAWSMFVNSDGNIVETLPVGYEGAVARQISDAKKWTLYRQWGDWFLWLSIGVLGSSIVNGWAGQRAAKRGRA
ncbi:MAG: hypothetical protein KF836_06595 [Fimbriimonadaceae bacterium]|nr:hypothetical protein [Fimbriimonadaceae bacterium]